MQASIFLSYSSKDRERLLPLIQSLEKEGFDLWWDQEIPIGKTYDQVIEERLKKAKVVLVVWSKNSIASNWVKAEAAVARDGLKMIPVLLEPTKVPLGFSRLQTADLSDWKTGEQHTEYNRVVREIKILLKRPIAEPSQPPKPRSEKKRFLPYVFLAVLALGLFSFLFWKMNQPKKITPSQPRVVDEVIPENDGSLDGVVLDGGSSIQAKPEFKPNKNIENISKAFNKKFSIEAKIIGKWQLVKKSTMGVESKLNEMYPVMEFKPGGTVEYTNPDQSRFKRKGSYRINNKMINFSANGKLEKTMNIEKLTESELQLNFLDSKSASKRIPTVEMRYKKID